MRTPAAARGRRPRRRSGRARPGYRKRLLRLQRLVQERQAGIHAVVDVRMVVVEFLVSMLYARRGEARREQARAVVDVVLVAPPAVDVDAAQGFEVGAVSGH